jgi:hypothetical protein
LALRLRATLGLAFSEAKSKLEPGAVLSEHVLFETDHDDVAAELRALIDDIEQTHSAVTVFELPDNQTFEACANPDRYIITPTLLRNALDEHDSRRVR